MDIQTWRLRTPDICEEVLLLLLLMLPLLSSLPLLLLLLLCLMGANAIISVIAIIVVNATGCSLLVLMQFSLVLLLLLLLLLLQYVIHTNIPQHPVDMWCLTWPATIYNSQHWTCQLERCSYSIVSKHVDYRTWLSLCEQPCIENIAWMTHCQRSKL